MPVCGQSCVVNMKGFVLRVLCWDSNYCYGKGEIGQKVLIFRLSSVSLSVQLWLNWLLFLGLLSSLKIGSKNINATNISFHKIKFVKTCKK